MARLVETRNRPPRASIVQNSALLHPDFTLTKEVFMHARITTLLFIALSSLLLVATTGCSTDKAEQQQQGGVITGAKPAKGEQPVQGALEGVEIAGYCPVAYVDANKPVKGVSEYPVQFNGMTYWFVNEEAQSAFVSNPGKYKVAYRGWCATALAQGQKVTSDPTIFRVYAGTVYLFVNEEAATAFEANPAEMVEKADQAWVGLQ